MNNKRKFLIGLILIILIFNLVLTYSKNTLAVDETNYILVSDEKITVNGEEVSENDSADVYLTTKMENGGNSEEAEKANIQIRNVININKSGIYEFTGKLSEGQIAINSNEIKGNVVIVFNNVEITCQNAPAIFVYNINNNSSTCTVTIKLADNSKNIIAGGKIKQSVEGWQDQNKLLYYVDKGYDDDRNYYERYKYDGAISSDISLTFEGNGTLIVNALAKEGIESKRDITINSGNYIINSLDDGINACTDKESIITINDGNILVNVLEEAEEGDGIDSNGSIYINGGKVYAFAREKSQDSGLDSDTGIYINGGYVVGTGNMADEVNDDSKQEFMQMQFQDKVLKDTLITILDESKNPIIAFKTDRTYSILTVSSPKFNSGEYYAYEGGEIEGKNENGVYTEITEYKGGTIKEYNNPSNMMRGNEFRRIQNPNESEETNYNVYKYTSIILGIVLVILVIITIILSKTGKFNIKGGFILLLLGLVIGAIITTAVFYFLDRQEEKKIEQNGTNMLERPEMPGVQGEIEEGFKSRPTEQGNLNQEETLPEKPQ